MSWWEMCSGVDLLEEMVRHEDIGRCLDCFLVSLNYPNFIVGRKVEGIQMAHLLICEITKMLLSCVLFMPKIRCDSEQYYTTT